MENIRVSELSTFDITCVAPVRFETYEGGRVWLISALIGEHNQAGVTDETGARHRFPSLAEAEGFCREHLSGLTLVTSDEIDRLLKGKQEPASVHSSR